MTPTTPTATTAGVHLPACIMAQLIADASVQLAAVTDDIETLSNIDRDAYGHVVYEQQGIYGVALANLHDELTEQTVALTTREMQLLAAQIFDAVGTGTTGYAKRPF